MRFEYKLPSIGKYQLLAWAQRYEIYMFLDAHKEMDPLYNSDFDFKLAVEAVRELKLRPGKSFESLSEFLDKEDNDWVFGGLSFDLKNELEELCSNNEDKLGLEQMYFFVPKFLFETKNGCLTLLSLVEVDIADLILEIQTCQLPSSNISGIEVKSSLNKANYISKINSIKKDIQAGDIYEMNFCQNFYADGVDIDPLFLFRRLNDNSSAPFSTFFKYRDFHLISASPERYISKRKKNIISQPIKGTRMRGKTELEDLNLKNELRSSEKDRNENVMIVDLVRNDLSRIAKKSTVEVTDLFGVYSFPHVHQMISTIRCVMAEEVDHLDVIMSTFPMGSMTGAPKISALKLIEKYEDFKRSFYSGSMGYFTPNRDFDFNVIIRSVLYRPTMRYLSFPVGGAITIDSSPEGEYEECLIKIQGVLKALNANLINIL